MKPSACSAKITISLNTIKNVQTHYILEKKTAHKHNKETTTQLSTLATKHQNLT
jgi:hypothetical protein